MAAARTMTARYRGACRSCAGSIIPGDQIVYAGRGLTYHVGECADHHDPDAAPAPRRERTWKQRYGRCEDAPCCGCC